MNRSLMAVCVPTYNSSIYVEEMLDMEAELYERYGIDLYIYDSSEDSHTENIVKRYQKERQNIYYVKVPSDTHSNAKVYRIFQDIGKEGKYEFLWVCKDNLRYNERGLKKIVEKLAPAYTVLVPDINDMAGIGLKEYDNQNELFYECANYMTMYGAVILNVGQMMEGINWAYYSEKYLREDTINFSHFCFYFENMLVCDSFKAIHIRLQGLEGCMSNLKKDSFWKNETFRIWCHCWPSAVYSLPGYYENKSYIVKNQKILSELLFMQLRSKGIYNLQIFFHYYRDWKKLTDISSVWLMGSACIPPKAAEYLCNRETNKQLNELVLFCKRAKHLYIYGAGEVAGRYVDYLKKRDIGFEAFIVTDNSDHAARAYGHPVLGMKDYIRECYNKNDGIVLAMNETNMKNVEKMLEEKGLRKNVYSHYIDFQHLDV